MGWRQSGEKASGGTVRPARMRLLPGPGRQDRLPAGLLGQDDFPENAWLAAFRGEVVGDVGSVERSKSQLLGRLRIADGPRNPQVRMDHEGLAPPNPTTLRAEADQVPPPARPPCVRKSPTNGRTRQIIGLSFPQSERVHPA